MCWVMWSEGEEGVFFFEKGDDGEDEVKVVEFRVWISCSRDLGEGGRLFWKGWIFGHLGVL